MKKLPQVYCEGTSAAAVGFAHGSQLRSRIAETIRQYFSLFSMFGVTDNKLQSWAEQHRLATEESFPEIAHEILGIAKGAEQKLWKIWALNARTEILARALQQDLRLGSKLTAVPECTSVFHPAESILAQNWDWDLKMNELPVLLHVSRPDIGLRVLTMTEPGIVAKIGLNSHGVGCLLNILAGPARPDNQEHWKSVPVHCLLGATLASKTLDAAETAIRKASRYTASNVFIGDSLGSYKIMEFAGATMQVIESQIAESPLVAHTNHYLHPRLKTIPSSIAHTIKRLKRVKALAKTSSPEHLGAGGETGLELIKRVLGDTSDGAESILYQGASAFGGKVSVGTICSIIMDLPQRKMHITQGSAMSQQYKEVTLLSSKL